MLPQIGKLVQAEQMRTKNADSINVCTSCLAEAGNINGSPHVTLSDKLYLEKMSLFCC